MYGVKPLFWLGLGVFVFAGAFATAVRPVSAAGAEAGITAGNVVCKGCVDKKDIGKKAVKSKHIKDGQVKTPDLADGGVTSDKLGAEAVTSAKLGAGAVTTEKLGAAAVTVEKLDATAKTTAYAAGQRRGALLDLGGAPLLMDQTSVEAPGAGTIVVNFAVSLFYDGVSGLAQCFVVGGTINVSNTLPCVSGSQVADQYMVCSGVQSIPVSAAGTVDLGVYCQEDAGAVQAYVSSLAATYSLAGTVSPVAGSTSLPQSLPAAK